MSSDTTAEQTESDVRFVECPFPEHTRSVLLGYGGMPIKAVVWKRDDDVTYGMLAVEPCGEHGELQRHLSISASSRGTGLRWPTDEEISEAASAVGLKLAECEVLRKRGVVHLFRASM